MKSLAIIIFSVAVLIIIVANGYDVEHAQQFHNNVFNCNAEFNITRNITSPLVFNVRIFRCVLQREENVFESDGQINKVAVLSLLVDIIPDVYDSMRAQLLFRECYKNATSQNISTKSKATKMIKCILPSVRQTLSKED